MKKLVLAGSLVVSSLYAFSIGCSKISFSTMMPKVSGDKCFSVSDMGEDSFGVPFYSSDIHTKVAGKDFKVFVAKKVVSIPTATCWNAEPAEFDIVDTKTGEVLAQAKDVQKSGWGYVVTFNVPKAYKDVSVKVKYGTKSYKVKEVTCPTTFTKYAVMPVSPVEGIFGVPVVNPKNMIKTAMAFGTGKPSAPEYKCYKYVTEVQAGKEDISDDNFAVRPDKFDIHFKKSTIRIGAVDYTSIKVVDANGNVVDTYNKSSKDLEVSGDVQYGFEIINGVSRGGQFIFYTPGKDQVISVKDTTFADVDKDDTTDSCREIVGTQVVNVKDISKNWAGRGTEEVENNPKKTTVQSDVRQNVRKDLHFVKINW